MKTSLVTGGAGFIGSTLVRALLERGDTVRVLDDFSTGKRENLSPIESEIVLYEGDIRDNELLAQAFQGVDLVFHQAAFVSVPLSIKDPETCLDVNVQGTLKVLMAAQKAEVERVVLASSAAVYGDTPDIPLSEESRLNSLSPYAASKRVNEVYAELFTQAFALDVVALRYFNVYGPRQSPTSDYAAVIPIFIHRLLDGKVPVIHGDGGQSRDFIFVEDVARANLLAAEAEDASGRVFNICTGDETTIKELLNVLRNIIPNTPKPEFAPSRPGDIYRSLGNGGLAADVLGFQPQVSIHRGLKKTINSKR